MNISSAAKLGSCKLQVKHRALTCVPSPQDSKSSRDSVIQTPKPQARKSKLENRDAKSEARAEESAKLLRRALIIGIGLWVEDVP